MRHPRSPVSLRAAALVGVALISLAAPAVAAPGHLVGLTLELGAPDLVGLRLTVRPRPWLRLNLGPVSDIVSAGIGAGITVVPLHTLVSPSLTLDAGYFFDGDTRGLAQAVGVPAGAGRVAYGYLDGHVGLEIGANRRVCFFLHAGVSYLDLTAHSTTGAFTSAHLTLFGPSAKLGLTVFL